MKNLIKQFNLYGKITEQHAKDIEEILENYDKKVKKETAEKVYDKMIGEIEKIKNIEMFGKNFDYDNGFNDGLNEVESKIKKQILKEIN